ncbi:30S ribosomal protein S8 [Candidatus Microgenomates bacterium]|nr:30S ribosomal protein S8 [Candidatus Microgenomates bacterium]
MVNTTTDPIADMLARIGNSLRIRQPMVNMPFSKTKERIAKLLKTSGFITDVKRIKNRWPALELTIFVDGNPKISGLERISKPGRRVYVKSSGIPVVRSGQGIVIISTSQGLMTGKRARARRLGGELICKVW